MEEDIKMSDLIVAKDNILQTLTFGVNLIVEEYASIVTNKEKIDEFKELVIKTVNLGQDLGVIVSMITAKMVEMVESEDVVNE